MHGLIFLELQKFVKQVASTNTWALMHQELGAPLHSYSPARSYPDELAVGLVGAASTLLAVPVPQLLQKFGAYLGPSLIKLYGGVIDPSWQTLDLLEHTERLIHSAVRTGNPGARPPQLECTRTTADEAIIVYASERKLCYLAEGIVLGIAEYFGELVEVTHDACMHKGDPFCALHVARRGSQSGRVTEHMHAGETLSEPPHSGSAESAAPLTGTHRGEHTLRDAPVTAYPSAGDFSTGISAPEMPIHEETRRFLSPPLKPDELGRVGHFCVTGVLGRGGMGIVLRAVDLHLERPVAIKVMRPAVASSVIARQRFLREARALASIGNSHLVTVYEVGLVNDHPFIAMELLEGETVLARQRRLGRLPVADILRFAQQAARGLAAIHERGYVHRDITPNNLWLKAGGDELKILDFGLTREPSSGSSLTRAGAILGTPAYMSPECVRGEVIDGRSDLFSLGCVLYLLCTGDLAFPGADLLSTLSALASRTPTAPSELVPTIPAALSQLVMQLIAKERSERPASANEVVRILEALESTLTL
jgi:hypothetical protein